jgi:DNA-binding MarR family transcriptional regulator
MTVPIKAIAESGSDKTITELASRLRHSLLRVTRLIRSQRTDTSVTLAELSALTTLCREGPMSAGELAMCEHVQPPSLTKVLASLEDYKLVRRGVLATDRRQAVIEPTQLGRRLLASEQRSRDTWLAVRLERLTAQERDMLDRVAPILDKLAADELEPDAAIELPDDIHDPLPPGADRQP